ncbi:hypothetical protein PIIN_03617 [Serendipita indica DSM 11827]|uniref:Uncharacterized protein n=1 Tax=Serendipita indica (strain DSM 11827) TaxID=1109443 RepID=G4TEC3_SERID|nr:hypothetical protein PIIN_03617 [Serendipita indica DSM 11827]
MSFPLPAAGSKPSGPLAQISAGKKQTRYTIAMSSAASGGEELIGARCLLPRASKGGKLQIAPRPITGALVLSEVVTSGPVEATVTEPDIGRLPLPSSTRHSHPAHLLKHKFVPTAVPNDAESIQLRDRDVNAMDIVEEDTNDNRDPEPSSPRKHKKRKKEDLKAEQISKRPRVE